MDAVKRTAAERMVSAGYGEAIIFDSCSYDDALIGVTHDGRAVYDYDKMVAWLMRVDGFTEEAAIEWIEYNTLRAMEYAGPEGPIILYRID